MAADVLEIYLADIRRLFNSMDPAPFHERDLDPNAADYILEWAEELAARAAGAGGQAGERHSARRQRRSRRAVGPRSLPAPGGSDSPSAARHAADGALQPARRPAVPRPVIVIAESAARMVQTERYAALIENSLVIRAWVALWRRLEISSYDWWPVHAEAKLFDRLGQMDVRTVSAGGQAATASGSKVSTGPAPAADGAWGRTIGCMRGIAFVLRGCCDAEHEVGAISPSARSLCRARHRPPAPAAARRRATCASARYLALLPHFLWESCWQVSTWPALHQPRMRSPALRFRLSCRRPSARVCVTLRDDHQPLRPARVGRRRRRISSITASTSPRWSWRNWRKNACWPGRGRRTLHGPVSCSGRAGSTWRWSRWGSSRRPARAGRRGPHDGGAVARHWRHRGGAAAGRGDWRSGCG